jgi:NitT/TauT family transport system substrate-binding protein
MIDPVRSSLRLCGAALAFLPLIAGAFAQDANVATLKVGTAYPGAESMPVYVARDNGYFRDEHLSVSLTYLSTGDKIAYALLSGSIDIARYTPDWFIRAVMKGGSNVKIVLGSANVLTFSLIAPNSVKGYADLRGKRIGVSTIAAADTSVVIKMLAAHGLKRGDYSLIQAGSSPERAAALHAGSLGATLLSPPADQRLLDDGGYKRLDVSTNVIPHYAWGAETVREDWAQANKPKLVAYMRAWIKAYRFLHDPTNKEAVIKLLARESKIDDRYARTTYDIYYGPNAAAPSKDGKLDPLDYQVMIADMVERGQIDPPPPSPGKFLDTSYWQEAEQTLR